MSSSNKRQLLAQKKQRLIAKIEQQRADLSAASQNWLQVTAPYDRAWQTMMAFRPILIAATGLMSIYLLKKPKRIVSLGKKALATWGLVRTFKSAINANKK